VKGNAEAELAHAANLLGALALAVTDRTFDGVAAAGESGSSAVALSALLHFLDRPTIDLMRRVLGLTSSGAVRLVDRLESAGWVKRAAAADGRATAVELTAAGRRVAKRVSAARAHVLKSVLSELSQSELHTFDRITALLLMKLTRGPGAERWLCRFCNMDACGWRSGGCPVRNARERRSGA
jgi:DNA-binding MarR family transcriptional regulator